MKRVVSCLAAVWIALFFAGSAGAAVVIKVANAGPDVPDNRTVKAVEIFRHLVETQSKGAIEVKAFHASKLGNEREALEGVRMGTIEMATLSSGPVPGFFDPAVVFDIPYLFSSAPAAWKVFDGPFGKEFSEAFLQKTGVRILAISENGYRHFTNDTRVVKSPADMKGLKVRTMENPAHIEMVKALGADPTPIAFGELYMALQQKVVDGMECPVVLIHDMKFYEVQKHMILDGHLYNPIFIFMNEKFFQSKLNAEQRKIVAEAAVVLAHTHNGFSQEANIQGIEKLKAQGMQIYQPSAEELNRFRQVSQPAGLSFVRKKAGEEWTDKVLKAAEGSEKEIGAKADQIVQEIIKYANAEYAKIKK